MKKYVKKLLTYSGIMTIVAVLAYVLWSGGTIGGILISVTFLLILLDIGRIMQNKAVKQRYFIYLGIIVGEVIVILSLSAMLNIGTVNTWLGTIGANVILGTMLVMLFDVARFTSKKSSLLLRVIGFLGVFVLLVTNIGMIASNLSQ